LKLQKTIYKSISFGQEKVLLVSTHDAFKVYPKK